MEVICILIVVHLIYTLCSLSFILNIINNSIFNIYVNQSLYFQRHLNLKPAENQVVFHQSNWSTTRTLINCILLSIA